MPRASQFNADNPWKIVSLGLMVGIASALLGGAVVATYRHGDPPVQSVAPASRAAPRAVVDAAPQARAERRPSAADVERCNREATAPSDRVTEAFKSAVIGSAIGAGVGAAGGAIADGGHGAGKGAGIGAIVGATAGTLYGINNANHSDPDAQRAYRLCMARSGF